MTDAQLAVIGLGSVGSMALWQAAQRSNSVVGFEAASPAHPRSAVGGDTRLFRMTYRGDGSYYPILRRAERLWQDLERESGRAILTRCGGLSIGEVDGDYVPALLESIKRTGAEYEILDRDTMEQRHPQHRLGPNECAIFDPRAGVLRSDQAVLAAIDLAERNGATVRTNTPIREIRETRDGVRISTEGDSWTFDRVIVSSGSWSAALLPEPVRSQVRPARIFLTWFAAREPAEFSPDRFPIFIHITGRLSLYGTPALDGASVKATLDGRAGPAADPDRIDRALTADEIAEAEETVREFLPGLIPSIVRSDTYPDLYTTDNAGLVGPAPGSDRIYLATGFSGIGFKMASAFGAIAAAEALGGPPGLDDLDFLRPARYA